VKLRKFIKYYIEYYFLCLLTYLLRLFPLKINLWFAAALGQLLYHLNRKHKKRALDNLKHSFPGKKQAELDKIIWNMYINLAKAYIEFLYIPGLNKDYIKKKVNIIGKENLDKALKKKKGVISITGHIDNWELLGAILVKVGYPVSAIYHPMKNPYSNRFINRIRQKAGMNLIPLNNSFRLSLQALRQNHLLGLIADQDAGSDGVFVNFFNRPASTAKGPAYFAIKTKAPVLLFTLVRDNKNNHTLYISSPLKIKITGHTEKDIYYNTKLWSDELEKWVRLYPDQWFWVHRKWHTKPE